MIISLIVLSLSSVDQPPAFLTAQERWACEFPAYGGKGNVTEYFGVFRSHVQTKYLVDYSIIQNDDDALVFSFSDIGNTDIEGKTRKWVQLIMIDRKNKAAEKHLLEFGQADDPKIGKCSPY